MNLIEKLVQSGVKLTFDQALEITFTIIRAPDGQGNRSLKRKYKNDWGGWKAAHTGHGGCFITINNKDNLCCARALVVAKAREDKDPRFKIIKCVIFASSKKFCLVFFYVLAYILLIDDVFQVE